MENVVINSKKIFTSTVSWGSLNKQLESTPKGKYFGIIDNNAEWFFKKNISKYIKTELDFLIEPSEKVKSQSMANKIVRFLLKNKADRDSILLSVGGGVTSDLTGYVASVYKRGIPWISIPTTLLSQVDASVGGKTAINSTYGKNVIGTFYPPNNVIMSHEPSESWSDVIWLEGLAEMIKIFLVFRPEIVDEFLKKGTADFSDAFTQESVKLKSKVVMIDPWEKHLRSALNYGHTFGHAIEHKANVRHGLAVSMGIRIANRIAVLKGIMKEQKANEIDSLLDKLDFPKLHNLPGFGKIYPTLMQDKKNVSSEVMMVLIDGERPVKMKPKKLIIPVSIDTLKKGYELSIQLNQ